MNKFTTVESTIADNKTAQAKINTDIVSSVESIEDKVATLVKFDTTDGNGYNGPGDSNSDGSDLRLNISGNIPESPSKFVDVMMHISVSSGYQFSFMRTLKYSSEKLFDTVGLATERGTKQCEFIIRAFPPGYIYIITHDNFKIIEYYTRVRTIR